jgi:hypothetical protein
MSLDTNMEIIHSPLQNGANEATSQPSDAAFAYENVHHSIPEESRIKFYKRCRGSNVVEKEKKNMPVVDNKEKKCGKKKKIMSSKENEVAQEAMRQGMFLENFVEGLNIKTRKVEDLYADVSAKNSVLNCLAADEIIDSDVEVCKSVLEEYKCGGKVHESKNLLNRCCSTSSADYEKILPLKRSVSKDNTELSKGVLEDELKDANESKKARMCSARVCLSETQGEGKNYAIGNKVSLSSHEFGEFISSNVSNEIDGYGDEAGIKSPFCDRNGEKGNSVSPFTSDMIIDLENRIQKLERVIAKLKEARFGHKVDIV